MRCAAFFSAPANLADKTIGDVALGDDGRVYAVTLDNSGTSCWTCIEDEDMSTIIVALLRTIKWSAVMQQRACLSGGADVPFHAGAKDVGRKPARRKKTAYKGHIGKVLRELAVSHPDMPRKERMRMAVNSWKEVRKDKSSMDPTDKFTMRQSPVHAPVEPT